MYEIYCKLRDERGMKDSDVVKGTGITKSTFSDWKNGRSNPKNEKLQKIADFFGVTLDYLLTGKEDPDKKDDPYEAKDDIEHRYLLLCRKAGDVPREEKEAILRNFEATMDMYLRAKGIKKE